MKQFNGFVLVLVTFLLALSIESCTKKTLMTGEDGFKYYQVTRNHRIGVKDLDGNVIVPVKMREISYSYRYNKQHDKERWFWCCCYDNEYKEIYNADNAQCIISENSHYKVAATIYHDKDYDRGSGPTSTFFGVRQEGKGKDWGVCDFSGKEIIPKKHEHVGIIGLFGYSDSFSDHSRIDTKTKAKYYDSSDLIYCKDYHYFSVYDANGRCIIPDEYKYISVRKVNVPTSIPLIICEKRDGGYDYRFSTSGDLFLSCSSKISVRVVDKNKELYYLSYEDEDKAPCYCDIYGKLIMKGESLGYDDERGFSYRDDDWEERYINKKIDENGHVVPAHTYSNSSWGWSDYGNQDIWMGLGFDGGYEWNDYSGSSNSYSGGSTGQPNTHRCGLCNGTGRVIENNATSFGNTKYCSECGKTVPDSHYHATCPSCKGKGYW